MTPLSRRGLALTLAAAIFGCSSPSAPAVVKDESVCQGFDVAGKKMRGGLKRPVRLRVLSDGETTATVTLVGIQDAAHPTRFLLPDASAEYTLEFAQCANERAPHPDDAKPGAGTTRFECADPTVYETVKHTTKSGDPSTMVITFVPPPVGDCWAPPAAPPRATTASASAAPTAAPEDDPGKK